MTVPSWSRLEWTDALGRDRVVDLRPAEPGADPHPSAPEWHHRAACAGSTSTVFSPDHTTRRGYQRPREHPMWQAALAICATCPVKRECLAASLAETTGVWGGTVPAEREEMRGDGPRWKYATYD